MKVVHSCVKVVQFCIRTAQFWALCPVFCTSSAVYVFLLHANLLISLRSMGNARIIFFQCSLYFRFCGGNKAYHARSVLKCRSRICAFVFQNAPYVGCVLRREGDSNPRNGFAVYTLSRRAS